MYRQLTPTDFRKFHFMPKDYVVSGFLCHGTWKRDQEIENLKNVLTEMKLDFKISTFSDFLYRITEFEINRKKYWFDVPYGGAMLSEYLHLACMFGSKKNILIGTCGGLSPQAKACDCIIPTWSYGDESSTRMYSQKTKDNHHFPNGNLSKSLRDRINPNIKVWEGPTMTCQAMLGESWKDVQTWSKDGYLGVEMEASTLFSVSNHFKVPSAALLIIGDNLIKEETVLHENYLKTADLRYSLRKEFLKISIQELLEI